MSQIVFQFPPWTSPPCVLRPYNPRRFPYSIAPPVMLCLGRGKMCKSPSTSAVTSFARERRVLVGTGVSQPKEDRWISAGWRKVTTVLLLSRLKTYTHLHMHALTHIDTRCVYAYMHMCVSDMSIQEGTG